MNVFIKAVLALSTLVTALNDVYKEYNRQKQQNFGHGSNSNSSTTESGE